ncbi:unnamed protein product [Prorocentrum cordatum]|uniref:Uncharacterized protein n=1 Tax=Prorocentrum cordatum TaxID=2364126 RepID=A0ABN9QMC6_9DINO|nr:unnamed protein product [Polarella glacialis]
MGSWTQLLVEDPKAGKAKYRLRGKSIKLNVADKIKRGHDGLFDSLGSKQLRIVMPYHAREDIFNDASDVAKRLGSEFPRLDMSNSNIKYCQLARGEADLLWYMTTGLYEKETNEPVAHHVAGVLLAEEAGAQVADLDGKPIQWCGSKMSENRGIIVTDPSILMIEGVVNAVRDGTVTSIEEYDKRCEKRQEINNDMRKIFDTMGKLTSGDEKTIREAKERNLLDDENEFKNEKKGFESATKSIEKYLDDDRQMNELANDAIRSTKPMLGNRSPERT